MIIRARAYPRAGLIGNPSDGYHGKTISFVFRNFAAEVVLYETPELEILPNLRDHSRFESIQGLAADVAQFGYYGGIRLLKATVKRFHDYCRDSGIELHDRNFTIRYSSNIPSQVGLAGSSAIITACMRALMGFYQVSVPLPVLANLVLSVETKELCIPAGLQDRVAQVYEGLVFMDFDKAVMDRQGWGHYEPLDPKLLPPLYIAYRADLAEGTEVLHSTLRERYNRGDAAVIEAIRRWAELAERVRDMLRRNEGKSIGPLLDENFDIRRGVCDISEGNLRMVETARAAGASAKFTGSGGAIVGMYEDEAMYGRIEAGFGAMGVKVFKPMIVSEGHSA